MRQHPEDLDINAAVVCAAEIPEEFPERRWSAKRIFGEDAEELFRLRAETR
jgi:hypothetical protein